MTTFNNYYQSADGTIYRSDRSWAADDKALSKAEGKRLFAEQCAAKLREMLKPGQTVYTILRHVSSSGMSRRISLAIVDSEGKLRNIDFWAANAMDDKIHKDGGIVISGCGMDMGFALVYNLGRTLWPNGTPEPYGRRNGEPDSAGGYALKHSWI